MRVGGNRQQVGAEGERRKRRAGGGVKGVYLVIEETEWDHQAAEETFSGQQHTATSHTNPTKQLHVLVG